VYAALRACGGSTAIEADLTYYDQRTYLLVGRCNAGLDAGFSAANGLEKKQSLEYMSLELQFGASIAATKLEAYTLKWVAFWPARNNGF
jgi:hypothetical protein